LVIKLREFLQVINKEKTEMDLNEIDHTDVFNNRDHSDNAKCVCT
jgi:hypothetical protein